MKTILFSLLFLGAIQPLAAQHTHTPEYYLAGAVPVKDGYVVFEQHFDVPGKTQSELFERIAKFTQEQIVEGQNHLDNCRITERSPEEGIIAASVSENLWFKRTALVWDFTEFSYQLVFRVQNGAFDVTLRRIQYRYEPAQQINMPTIYYAEDWITDKEALNEKQTKLTKIAGKKFRAKTIDRKDEIFEAAYKACL